MRKQKIVLLLLSLLLLSSCAKPAQAYEVTQGNTLYIVDPAARTVTQGDQVYHYFTTEDSVAILYPDESVYWQRVIFDTRGYDITPRDPLGETLVSVLKKEWPSKIAWHGPDWVSLLFVAVGLWGTISPKSIWYLGYGWHYKNAEPSDTSLFVHRLLGIAVILLGVFMQFT